MGLKVGELVRGIDLARDGNGMFYVNRYGSPVVVNKIHPQDIVLNLETGMPQSTGTTGQRTSAEVVGKP